MSHIVNVVLYLLVLVDEDISVLYFNYSVFKKTLNLAFAEMLQVNFLKHLFAHDESSKDLLN